MKNGIFILLSFFIIQSSPLWSAGTSYEKMMYFTSSKRSDSFSILVPQSWSMSASFDQEIPSYSFFKDSALITVKVLPSPSANLSDIIRGEFISLLDKDPSCSQILDTDEYLTAKNIKVRLVVFEYKDSKTKKATVHRSYFLNNENRIFIITCSAPRSVFYKFEDIFTSSMGSFRTGTPAPQPAQKIIIPKEQPVEPGLEPQKEPEVEKESEEKAEKLPQEESEQKEAEPKPDEEQKTKIEPKENVEEQTAEVKAETPIEPQTPEEKELYEPKPDENTTPKKGDEPPPYTNSTTIP
jgi:hypothetical protein